ncbi:hypothetical protein ACFPM7_03645 [Actinokineospora guangxiensis]|uniref:Tetratricopeptide repeat protein n=1 Tax=Actinokineospora guangxiensis TaxID=1490288 RepID=A0ABW0EFG7_9PSEU
MGGDTSSVAEQLRSAAFGATPAAPLPGRVTGGRQAWLAGVALGGRGHYAAAAAHLLPLVSGPDRELAALAAATRAAHLRQLGGHAEARRWDAVGLAKAGTGEARSDALLGLAADAIGAGRVGEARRLVERDTGQAGERSRVRRGWLRAELALAAGDAAAAVAPAREAVAVGFPSVRHRVKSGIVLGVALAAAGERDEALALLDGNLRDAIGHRLAPLVWPAALVLAELGQTERKEQAREALHCVLRHSDPIARRVARRSPWVPTWLFASAPNR